MRNDNGITLIALIIVVTILAILLAVLITTSTGLIGYTHENRFISELKIIREKVNIVNKEISIGSTSYDNVGQSISSLSVEMQSNIQKVFTMSGISASEQSGYKYFNKDDLNKIGIFRY